MEDLMKWVTSELSTLLTFSVTSDMAKCILMIESPRDLEDYLQNLLDMTNPSHQKFVRELISKKQMSHAQGYKKVELDSYIPSKTQEKKDKKKGNKLKNEKAKETTDQKKEDEKENTKKKNKFRNIFDPDDKNVILLKGRHLCNCQASKHSLINNCLNCGRIVCEQEGAGPCFVCSKPVYKRGELPPKNNGSNSDFGLESALELRDRLLEYDKTSERRTKVIDDQCDYFSTNSVWLSKEQKEELKKKEEELQAIKHSRARNLILDFTGRRLIDDEFKKLNDESALLQDVNDYMEKSNSPFYNDNVDPNCSDIIEPVYEENSSVREKLFGSVWKTLPGTRVQDRQLMEMSDNGMCLSVHQPWATLLVAGIKCHEGRSWYTAHRGRLWIAAAAKNPTQEDIELVQNQYRLLKGDDIKFPKKYPVGCLLGCVNLVDCLAQEEYREIYEQGEIDAPFVFICESPTPCPVLFPIKGQHKIYKLDPKIHQAAAKCIQKLSMK